MPITASALHQHVYTLLDEVLATGVPIEIERKGKRLRIVPERDSSKLDCLKARPGFIRGDADLVHMDWLNSPTTSTSRVTPSTD